MCENYIYQNICGLIGKHSVTISLDFEVYVVKYLIVG